MESDLRSTNLVARLGHCTLTLAIASLLLLSPISSATASLASSITPLPAADDFDQQQSVAIEHYDAARWSESVAAWSILVDRFPNDPRIADAKFFLGESLMQLGRYGDSASCFRELLLAFPDHAQQAHAEFRIGEAEFLAGNAPAAAQALQHFIDSHPENSLRHFARPYLGELAVDSADWPTAKQHFEQGLRDDPSGLCAERCRFGLGRALEGMGQDDQAIRFYELVGLQGTSDRVDDALLNLAILYFRRSQNEEADQVLIKLTDPAAEHPLAARGLYLQGRIAQRRDKPTEALQFFEQAALAADARDPSAAIAIRYEWAAALRSAGQNTAAVELWQELLDRTPTHEFTTDCRRLLVEDAFDAGDWEKVLQLTESITSDNTVINNTVINSTDELLAEFRGRALLETEQFSAAAEVFRKLTGDAEVSSLSDERLAFPYLLGLSLTRAGQGTAALEWLEKVRQRELPESLLSGTLLASISAYRQAAETDSRYESQVVTSAQEFLQRFPEAIEVAQVQSELCCALARQGNFTAAETAWMNYQSQHPDHRQLNPTLRCLADQAFLQQEFNIAANWFSRLQELSTDDDERWQHALSMAHSLRKSGSDEKADATFRQVIAEAPAGSESVTAATVALARSLTERGQATQAEELYSQLISTTDESQSHSARIAQAADAVASKDPVALAAAARSLSELVQNEASESIDAVLYQLAWVERERNDLGAMRAAFESLVRRYPKSIYRADAAYRLADEALRRGDPSSAERWLQLLNDEHPDSPLAASAGLLKLQALAARKAWSELRLAADQFLIDYPDLEQNALAKFWSAEAAFRLDDRRAASAGFEALTAQLVEQPVSQSSWHPLLLLRLAQLNALETDWDQAEQWVTQLQQNYPEFRQPYEVDYLVGRIHAARGEFSAARTAYDKVVRSTLGGTTETAAMAQWMIGESWFHQQEYGQAIEAFRRVDTLYKFPKWQAAALLQSGKCYEQRSEPRQAVECYARLIREFSDSENAAEASGRLAAIRKASPNDSINTPSSAATDTASGETDATRATSSAR